MDLKDHFEEGWWQKLAPFFDKGGFNPIAATLAAQKKAGNIITPKFDDVFRAFRGRAARVPAASTRPVDSSTSAAHAFAGSESDPRGWNSDTH